MGCSETVWSPKKEAEWGSWNGNVYPVETLVEMIRVQAEALGFQEALAALSYAMEHHQGQVRKSHMPDSLKVPYIVHPLTMAYHAWTLGWKSDQLTAAALLHDVCEDCGIAPEALPFSDPVKHAVDLLTKKEEVHHSAEAECAYYRGLSEDPIAIRVKLLDRCHNVSGMASGFAPEKLHDYILRTERDFYPLLEAAENKYPEDRAAWFLIRYHMCSVVESLKQIV